LVSATTEHFGGLPGAPQSLMVGDYRSQSSLSVVFKPPVHDGGLPITQYLVEADLTGNFDPTAADYVSDSLAVVPEVQQITTYFRSFNKPMTGGTFTLSFGGKTSVPLSYAISAFDMAAALNILVRTQNVGIPPVVVTRSAFDRGYRWMVTFQGVRGDVGLILADSTMLVGDNPQMDVKEVVKGNADIVPGGFTYEVQSVTTTALSPISGTFTLNYGGYTTPPIAYDEPAFSFKQKLEALHTIQTVDVSRINSNGPFHNYTWIVTFAHMKEESVQGAGDLAPLIPDASNLFPQSSAQVNVFEIVKGSAPLYYELDGLSAGMTYNVRVTAYNNRGMSTASSAATAVTLGQPPAPVVSMLTISSGTSLM